MKNQTYNRISYSPAAEELLSKLNDSPNGIIQIDTIDVLTAIELEGWDEIKIITKGEDWFIIIKEH